jgi:uncharacterized membrane protein
LAEVTAASSLSAPAGSSPRRGFPYGAGAILAFAVIGIGITIYLTIIHYQGVQPVCSAKNGTDWFSQLVRWAGYTVNCGSVTSSAESVVLNTSIPITVPGLLWFLVSGGLAGMAIDFWRRDEAEPSWLPNLHALVGVGGLAFVMYLVFTEAVTLKEFCEWCSGVHLLVLLTFVVSIVRWQRAMSARYASA